MIKKLIHFSVIQKMTRLTVSKEEALPVLEYLFCSNNKKGIGTRCFLACVPLE